MRKVLITLSLLISSPALADNVAECINPEGTAGAYLFTTGTDLILQIAAVATSMDVYVIHAAELAPETFSLPETVAQLSWGVQKTLVFKKPTSTTEESTTTDAALFTLTVEGPEATAPNSTLAWRGKVMSLVCHPSAN